MKSSTKTATTNRAGEGVTIQFRKLELEHRIIHKVLEMQKRFEIQKEKKVHIENYPTNVAWHANSFIFQQ